MYSISGTSLSISAYFSAYVLNSIWLCFYTSWAISKNHYWLLYEIEFFNFRGRKADTSQFTVKEKRNEDRRNFSFDKRIPNITIPPWKLVHVMFSIRFLLTFVIKHWDIHRDIFPLPSDEMNSTAIKNNFNIFVRFKLQFFCCCCFARYINSILLFFVLLVLHPVTSLVIVCVFLAPCFINMSRSAFRFTSAYISGQISTV